VGTFHLYLTFDAHQASEVVTKLYSRFLTTNPLFRGLASEIIAALCHVVQPMFAVKEQCIIVEGGPGREMFFLMKGEVEMLANDTRLGFLAEGAFFGESAVLWDGSGAERRVRTVRAVTKCELCFLSRDAMQELRERYPELDARVRRFQRAGRRMSRKERAQLQVHLDSVRRRRTGSMVAAEHRPQQASEHNPSSVLLPPVRHGGSTAQVVQQASSSPGVVAPNEALVRQLATLQQRLETQFATGVITEAERLHLEDYVGALAVGQLNTEAQSLLALSIGLLSDDAFARQLRRQGILARTMT
jgi:CRP-like cAMP-binding protein